MADNERMPWRMVLAAGGAALVGNGLARFAFSPLIPVLIAEGWFPAAAVAYLGAANLLGYFIGAFAARRVGARFGVRRVLRGAMLTAAVSLVACCTPLPFVWFFVWRLLSGIMGGLLMILAPSAVLVLVPAARRGLAGGVVFTGVGLGIAVSGTIVPLLLRWGLTATWLGLGALSTALTLLAWREWPRGAPLPAVAALPPGRAPRGALPICVSYGLCAVGMVPHMVFMVDYIARGQGRGIAAGSLAWVMLGMGALVGAVLVGRLVDRVGATLSMRLVLVTQLGCVLALAGVQVAWASNLAIFVSGLCLCGISPAVLGRLNDLVGTDPVARQRGWTQATLAWAVGQAGAAYGLAWLFARTGGYSELIGTAAGALVLALALEAVGSLRERRAA